MQGTKRGCPGMTHQQLAWTAHPRPPDSGGFATAVCCSGPNSSTPGVSHPWTPRWLAACGRLAQSRAVVSAAGSRAARHCCGPAAAAAAYGLAGSPAAHVGSGASMQEPAQRRHTWRTLQRGGGRGLLRSPPHTPHTLHSMENSQQLPPSPHNSLGCCTSTRSAADLCRQPPVPQRCSACQLSRLRHGGTLHDYGPNTACAAGPLQPTWHAHLLTNPFPPPHNFTGAGCRATPATPLCPALLTRLCGATSCVSMCSLWHVTAAASPADRHTFPATRPTVADTPDSVVRSAGCSVVPTKQRHTEQLL
jgi:hypothetical protein